jgi:hypothetical protein
MTKPLTSYQNTADAEEARLLVADVRTDAAGRRHRPSWRHRFAVVVTALTVSLLLALPCLLVPTDHEMRLADRYGLNPWISARPIRQAQSLADASRLTFLSASDFEELTSHKVLRQIETKGSTAHYMEPPADGCEATVVILRHCEKGDIREHCDYMGYERSVYLATIFGDNQERWPAPSYIFAEGPGQRHNKKKMNFREIETVGPLSEKVGVLVDDR